MKLLKKVQLQRADGYKKTVSLNDLNDPAANEVIRAIDQAFIREALHVVDPERARGAAQRATTDYVRARLQEPGMWAQVATPVVTTPTVAPNPFAQWLDRQELRERQARQEQQLLDAEARRAETQRAAAQRTEGGDNHWLYAPAHALIAYEQLRTAYTYYGADMQRRYGPPPEAGGPPINVV